MCKNETTLAREVESKKGCFVGRPCFMWLTIYYFLFFMQLKMQQASFDSVQVKALVAKHW